MNQNLNRLLKQIKAQQPQVDLLNELKAELDNEVKNLPLEAQAIYNKHNGAVVSAMGQKDYTKAAELATKGQVELNKILRNMPTEQKNSNNAG